MSNITRRINGGEDEQEHDGGRWSFGVTTMMMIDEEDADHYHDDNGDYRRRHGASRIAQEMKLLLEAIGEARIGMLPAGQSLRSPNSSNEQPKHESCESRTRALVVASCLLPNQHPNV